MNKKRRDFLKLSGIVGATSLIPFKDLIAARSESVAVNSCVLVPSETAGPFTLDLTENTYFFRQDIRESHAGVQLNLKLRVTGSTNCEPMANLRLNIWHCTKDGVYSGYNTALNPGNVDDKHFRGYQFTDANGEVDFITILPGWYPGRITHIHFQVFVSSSYSAVSQFTFDLDDKNAIYLANPDLYPQGADPVSFAQDFSFSDGYSSQLATITPNAETGGYDSFLEVTILGSGALGKGHIENQNAKQFSLGQNFPNPYSSRTTIPFELKQASDVKMEVFSLQGAVIGEFKLNKLDKGNHTFDFDPTSSNLDPANYVYQITVENADGAFKDSKMMTAAK